MRYFLLLLLLLSSLHAKLLMTPFEAIHMAYGDKVVVAKKNILLKTNQAKAVSKIAHQKLKTKIYRTFKIQKDKTIIAYGILTMNKMRTKDAAVLTMVNLEGVIESIATIAFNEPPEFAPNKKWESLFEKKTKDDTLRIGKDLPTITGATLSARGYAKGVRLALAIYEAVLKK